MMPIGKDPLILAKLFLPQAHQKRVADWLTTIYLIRDLINTPAEDMGPSELAQAVKHIAKEFEVKVKIIESKDFETEFPAIYAVGRAGPVATVNRSKMG